MKSLLVLCVLLCAALSVRAATVLSAEDVAVKEEDVAPFVAVEAAEESIQQALEDEGINASPQVRFGGCPGNWHGYQGKCYLMVNDLRTWSDAEAHCSSQQASLASAHSFWEYSFMQQLARTAGHSYAWMGGYYFQSRWRWDDGTAYSYQNWYSQASTGSYQCIHLNTYESRGWSNGNCVSRYGSICSRSATNC